MSKSRIYFETEGVNQGGERYHSDQCHIVDAGSGVSTKDREFFHELLDEFLDAFPRDPIRAKLRFERCTGHGQQEPVNGIAKMTKLVKDG